jgi:hypothetical protein
VIRAVHSTDASSAEGLTAPTLCGLARKLVAEGFSRTETVQAFTPSGTPTLRGNLGWLADHYASDAESNNGTRFLKWRPLPGGRRQDGAEQPDLRNSTCQPAKPLAALTTEALK